MSTHKFTMHLYQVQFDFEDKPHFALNSSDGLAKHNKGADVWIYLGPRQIEVEVPDFQDVREHQIKGLREEERQLRADFQKRVTEINARIQSLLALEMS